MMRFLSTLGLVAVFAAGCMPNVPPARMASTETAVQSAEQAGAADVPVADQHLEQAQKELEQAKNFDKKGDRERAEAMLTRADADAALAATLTDEAHGKGQLKGKTSNGAKQPREPSR